jgi:hypothetical protein
MESTIYHSSLIRATTYDHEHHELEVVLISGEVRVYSEVPSAINAELEKCKDGSHSAGEYFQDNIEGKFPKKSDIK